MKVIRKRTFTVEYVVPETEEERQDIQRIIREVENEPVDLSKLRRVEPGQAPED